MFDTLFWEQLERDFVAITESLKTAVRDAKQESGLNTISGHWGQMVHALNVHPAPVDAARLQIRHPYTAPKRIKEGLQILSARGYLQPVGAGKFALTPRALTALEIVIQAQSDVFRAMDAHTPPAQLLALRDLTRRLANSASAQTFPHPIFDDLALRPITDDQPLTEQIGRYMTRVSALRDDAHVQSWKPLCSDGLAWDAFTHIWQGCYTTAEALAEGLAPQGGTARDYTSALKKLIKQGWITETQGQYAVTPQGQAVRQDVESRTNALFFACFDVLTAEELSQLTQGLHTLAGVRV